MLVDSALALLTEIGADALSLRAVARRAGVSAMAPYRHYPDKEALLVAVAARGFEGLRASLQAADDDAPAGEALAAQAAAYVGYAIANPALFRLMFGPARKEAHPKLRAAGDTAYGVLAARVAAETPEPGRDARVLGCWAMVHGLAGLFLDGLIDPAHGPPGAVTRAVAAAMLASAPPPAALHPIP